MTNHVKANIIQSLCFFYDLFCKNKILTDVVCGTIDFDLNSGHGWTFADHSGTLTQATTCQDKGS